MEAVRRSLFARTAAGRRENRLKQKQGYTKAHVEADVFLENLAFDPRPPLYHRDVMPTLCAAAKRNDKRFFIRLGKVLARKPKILSAGVPSSVPPLQKQFLIGNWVDSNGEYGDLCRYAADGLLVVMQHKFGRENVNFDVAGIDKLRRRLGLQVLRRPKIHVALVGYKLTYLD